MGEFELIQHFFQQPAAATPLPPGVVLGIGDDCALLQTKPGWQLAISTDMLLEGRHFFPNVNANTLGHKALAVNLSDLAAMGAEPLACTLAIALPPERAQNADWLQALIQGLLGLANQANCPLVGGDTTQGPLNLCITVMGQTPAGQALRRSGAHAGDDVWVSGHLGDARLALGVLRDEWSLPDHIFAQARPRLERPQPRLALGQALRDIASSALDVSDGLLGDLGHLMHASGLGATIKAPLAMQCSLVGADLKAQMPSFSTDVLESAVLAGGDDYELLFTAPPEQRHAVTQAGQTTATPVTRIGHMHADKNLVILDAQGQPIQRKLRGFDHFG